MNEIPLGHKYVYQYLNQRSPAIVARLKQMPETELAVCSVVKAELYTGAMKSLDPERTLAKQQAFVERFQSLPFDDGAVIAYARIRAALEQIGQTIGANRPYDCRDRRIE